MRPVSLALICVILVGLTADLSGQGRRRRSATFDDCPVQSERPKTGVAPNILCPSAMMGGLTVKSAFNAYGSYSGTPGPQPAYGYLLQGTTTCITGKTLQTAPNWCIGFGASMPIPTGGYTLQVEVYDIMTGPQISSEGLTVSSTSTTNCGSCPPQAMKDKKIKGKRKTMPPDRGIHLTQHVITSDTVVVIGNFDRAAAIKPLFGILLEELKPAPKTRAHKGPAQINMADRSFTIQFGRTGLSNINAKVLVRAFEDPENYRAERDIPIE
jgi:hypothetical protein